MFKILTLLFLCLSNVVGLTSTCFTPQDVYKMDLVSYNHKVYDIQNYAHPGGKRTLMLSAGKPLEEFFNISEYSFHKKSQGVVEDLDQIYIGDLKLVCNTVNNYNKHEMTIYYDPFFQYLMITLFFMLFIIIINKCIYSNQSINLPVFGYISIDIVLFYIIYIAWWSILLGLSFILDDILIRLGIWINLNIAFTLLPVTRNSIWITSLKISYNKLITFHKLIAILSLFSVIIKTIVVLNIKNIPFLFSNLETSMGTICSLSVLLTSILSAPYIRKNMFELFYYSHKVLFFITTISMSLHYISCLYFILPSIILYFVDLSLRLSNMHKAVYTKIQNIEFVDSTYIFITLKVIKNINTEPGCYFFLCCNDVSNLEWHPLSLVSKTKKNLLFCIKNMGDKTWSNHLKTLQDNKLLHETFEVYLQGPYYHMKLDYSSDKYEYIINISNGIGITPFISILNDINGLRGQNKLTKLKKSIFIWITPDISYITPFLTKFENFYEMVDIRIFVSKLKNDNDIEKYKDFFTIINGKPNIIEYIGDFLEFNNIHDTKDTCIISCGSPSLINDIYKISYKYKIKLFNESFD